MKQTSHLDFQKTSQAINAIVHLLPASNLEAVLTALGQIAYDQDGKRLRVFDGASIRTILQNNDILHDTSLGSGAPSTLLPPSQKSVKDYVDALFAAGFTYTDFDAASAIEFPSGANASSRYRVSTAGTVLTVVLEVGDSFYPKTANAQATVASDWVFVQSNVDEATASVLGLLKKAVLAELTGVVGGSDEKAVTVTAFKGFEAANPRVKKYTETLSLTAGSNVVTHGLNSLNVMVQLTDGSGLVLCDWTVSSVNAISINASVSLANVKVIVIG